METFNPQKNTANSPLIIRHSAIEKVKTLMKFENDQSLMLRVFITGGGCSGFQYGFSFDNKPAQDDIFIRKDGVTMVVDPVSIQYLQGAEVIYQEGLEGARFIVNNPNAKTTCGCGSSFSI